jgi:metallophosphoesterase (TIGR00282 family)
MARSLWMPGRLADVKLLFIGDVVGSPGRHGLAKAMPVLRERFEPDLTVVNGENSAGGMGITSKTAEEIFALGADVITLGNHTFRHREVYEYLDRTANILRPANYRRSNPGHGHVIVEGGMRVAVINLSGTVGLRAARSPFDEADILVEQLSESCDAIVVDFHAEVTSEKVALGWYLDGQVAAVLGTHTHVPTADGRVLPGGTAFISDVGMTGSRTSVLGVRTEDAIERMRTEMPVRFETATEDVWVMGAAVTINASGLADSIEPFMLPAS